MDGTEFHDTFFEEAGELLAEMERLLVALDTNAPDIEALNAIFRVAHSIKGGAGTFGFEALQNTTHVMENLLDLARRGELALDRAAVDRLLEAGDVLKDQLAAYRASVPPDAEAARDICEALSRIVADRAGVTVSNQASANTPGQVGQTGDDDGHEREIVIRLRGLKSGEADLLAEELALFGEVSPRAAAADDALETVLVTQASDEDIVAVLCFILDADQIEIEPLVPALALPVLRISASDVDAAVARRLSNELEALGTLGQARLDGTTWSIDLTSDLAIEDVVAVLGFEIDPARLSVTALPPADSSKPVAAPASEEAAAPARERKAREQIATDAASIRVPTDKIDHIINLVGELVITQSMLERAAADRERKQDDDLIAGLGQLAHNARDLQQAVMSMRMVPMDFAFNRFPRLVRDLGSRLGKEINLVTEGGATELDKGLIERIMDPMTHLVRNSLDHGIEDAATRRSAGKPAAGELKLSARHEGGNIVIEISDDGAGLSRERILAKARSSGLPVDDDMADAEVWQLIFAPGFSTAEQVSDVSGRGVGMDVVKRNINELGGHVDLHSVPGAGTTVSVVLPLTLAIMDGMAVRAGREVFILPLGAILESMRVSANDVRTIGADGRVLEVRGEYLRLIELHRAFDIPGAQTELERGIVMVVASEAGRFALFVDELLGQQQVVVKNLETHFRKVAGVSAATILGDGSVALIIDITAFGRPTAVPSPSPRADRTAA